MVLTSVRAGSLQLAGSRTSEVVLFAPAARKFLPPRMRLPGRDARQVRSAVFRGEQLDRVLDLNVASLFVDPKSVNDALRTVANVAKQQSKRELG